MTDKSKMPDFKEVTNIAGKLFSDIKKSVCEIIDDFKSKRDKPPKKTTTPGEVVSSAGTAAKKPEPKKAEPSKSVKKAGVKKPAVKKPAKPKVKKL